MNYTVKKSKILLLSVTAFAVTGFSACTHVQILEDVKLAQKQKPSDIEVVTKNTAILQDMAAVAIAVSDLQAAEAFYTDVLGMKTVRTLKTEAYDEAIMSTGNEKGTKLVLFKSHKPTETVSARIVFYTQDGDSILQKFKDRNLEIVRELSPIAEGVPIKIGIAKDADGNVLEFIQRK